MGKIADNPYPGSRAFQQADQARFYGREEDVAAVINLWKASRLTILTGPVASGKTSLLQAGVYPLMPVKRHRMLPIGNLCNGMAFPFPALAEHNPLTLALLRSWSPEDVPTRLAGLSVSEFLRRFAEGDDGATFAAIDQLDDFVVSPRHDIQAKWRHQFVTELKQALADHPRLHLLLVARSETLGVLASAVGVGARHEIAGLTTAGAVEALIRPAVGAGRSFAEEAAHDLIDDLRPPGGAGAPVDDTVEPSLLQAVAWQLWEDLPPSVTDISDWTLREFGDADAALALRCGRAIGEVAALYDVPFKRLRTWLVDNFITKGGPRGRRAVEDIEAAVWPDTVPRSLLDRHLLTREVHESVRYYRLLSRRLVEPLWKATIDRLGAPSPAEYLQAAERDLALGEFDDARAHSERALRTASGLSERAQAESLLGNVEYRRGKPAKALRHYWQASELRQATGDNTAAAYELAAVGLLLLAADELTGDQPAKNGQAENGPTQDEPAEQKPEDALPVLRAAVERAPNDLGLQTQLALALWQLGDGRGAVAILNWVLTIDGEYAEARRARGEILADLGEASSAMADLDRTVPGRPSTRAARGLALAELGDGAAAAKEVDGAVADARRNGPVLLYAARAFDLAGDKVSARERAREAIDATDPPLSPAHRQLAMKLASSKNGAR